MSLLGRADKSVQRIGAKQEDRITRLTVFAMKTFCSGVFEELNKDQAVW